MKSTSWWPISSSTSLKDCHLFNAIAMRRRSLSLFDRVASSASGSRDQQGGGGSRPAALANLAPANYSLKSGKSWRRQRRRPQSKPCHEMKAKPFGIGQKVFGLFHQLRTGNINQEPKKPSIKTDIIGVNNIQPNPFITSTIS